jgi:F-type H+-transporting ATPase subunit delta
MTSKKMKIIPKQYALALYESVKGKKDGEVRVVLKKFAAVLKNNGDLSKIKKIIDIFYNIWNEREGIVEAEITSARELDSKIVKLLNNYIVKLSGADTVKIQEKVDKKILGGVILRYGDKVVNASLKNRIESLKNFIN